MNKLRVLDGNHNRGLPLKTVVSALESTCPVLSWTWCVLDFLGEEYYLSEKLHIGQRDQINRMPKGLLVLWQNLKQAADKTDVQECTINAYLSEDEYRAANNVDELYENSILYFTSADYWLYHFYSPEISILEKLSTSFSSVQLEAT